MKIHAAILFAALIFSVPEMTRAADKESPTNPFPHSDDLQSIVDRAVKTALEKFADKKLQTN